MKVLGSILVSLALLGVGGVVWAAAPNSFYTQVPGSCPPCDAFKQTANWTKVQQLSQAGKVDIYEFNPNSGKWTLNGTGSYNDQQLPPSSDHTTPRFLNEGQNYNPNANPSEFTNLLNKIENSSDSQKQESLVVGTKYIYVGPGKGTAGPSDELIPHGRPLPPGQIISDSKQQVLAINAGTGRGDAVELGGALVGPGPYRVGPNCQDNRGIGTPKSIRLPKLDENSFEACKDTPQQGAQQNNNTQGGLNPFGGGTNPSGGGLGSNPLVPVIVQGLLSQALGGGQNGQTPYGAGYNQQQQQNCASIAQSPVCGADGKTYNNACYLRQAGVAIQKQGVCVQATPTPNIAAISQTIIDQLNASGIPASILEQVRNAVTSVLSSVFSSAVVGETIIR